MRTVLVLRATTTALSQIQLQPSQATENLRGVSAVTQRIARASGTHGTDLRTIDAGRTWIPAQVPDAATLDFRAIVAVSADEAFLMSAGPGDQSRIYHTTDAGQHWQLQFSNANPKAFFDSMVFWDPTHGIVLGDPIPDQAGNLKFELLLTNDGQTWTQLPPAQLPPAEEGEGAFAASNTCLAILSNRIVIPSEARDSGVAGTTPQLPSTTPRRNRGRAALQRRVSDRERWGALAPAPPPPPKSPPSNVRPSTPHPSCPPARNPLPLVSI
jgi:hypothetical protein